MFVVPAFAIVDSPVIEVPGESPRLLPAPPLNMVAPVFVTVVPASTA